MKGSVKELNKFHNYETEKITRKVSKVAEYSIPSCLVLPSEIVRHDAFNVIL